MSVFRRGFEVLAGILDAVEARPVQNLCIRGALGKTPAHNREGERAATQDVINLEKSFAFGASAKRRRGRRAFFPGAEHGRRAPAAAAGRRLGALAAQRSEHASRILPYIGGAARITSLSNWSTWFAKLARPRYFCALSR